MNENTKTAVLVLLAALVAVGVWLTRPKAIEDPSVHLTGTLLFPEFKDPLDATSLEVTKYNKQTGDVSTFAVAQVNNVWSIPSHENYPADAKDHLAAAAADLVDLKILGPAGDGAADSLADYATYGVLDPTDKNVSPGTPGVGTKIVMRGKDDKMLVSMIVGKADKDNPANRYVRRAGQDVVVVVPLSMDKLTAEFDAWIEKDLLKLSALDLREIYIQDYTIDEVQGALEQRDRMTLAYDDAAQSRWKMALNQVFQDGKWTPLALAPDEELDTARLDEMKSALDNLEIVDVARKPAGLSADLAASKEFLNNPAAAQSLAQRGFYLAQVGAERALYSNEGEVRCLMKDGVEYVLRFGNLAGSGVSDAGGETPDGPDADNKDAGGVNRYLLVMTEFNPSPIEKPAMEPLPEEPKPAEKVKDESKAPKPAPDEAKKTDAAKKSSPEETPKTGDLKAQREQVEKENKRKQDEYDARIAEGKKKVRELNARFADWYYVISEATYKKIHLGRKDIVKKKTPKKDQASNGGALGPEPPENPLDMDLDQP